MRKTVAFSCLSLALLCTVGCGDIAYQTRGIPEHGELSWKGELYELPWKPPALGEVHYPRSGTGLYAPGMGAPETAIDQDDEGREYVYPGDGRRINTRPDVRY